MVLSHKPSQKFHLVLRISQLSIIVQNWFCIYHLRMDLSFQEKKAFCKFVTWFKSYNNSSDTGEFRRFFKHPVLAINLVLPRVCNLLWSFSVFLCSASWAVGHNEMQLGIKSSKHLPNQTLNRQAEVSSLDVILSGRILFSYI